MQDKEGVNPPTGIYILALLVVCVVIYSILVSTAKQEPSSNFVITAKREPGQNTVNYNTHALRYSSHDSWSHAM